MHIRLMPFVAAWIALAGLVTGLAIYRRWLFTRTDEILHMGDESQIAKQATMAQRLDIIDRWGKIMTVIVALYGVLLAAIYFYQYWTESAQQLWG
jgi:hypothetical protein